MLKLRKLYDPQYFMSFSMSKYVTVNALKYFRWITGS